MLLTTVMITLTEDKVTPTTQINKEDQYHLRALNAELTAIQEQINRVAEQLHASEKVKERTELLSRLCGAANIPVASCNVDTETGVVTAIPKPAPPTPK